MTYAVRGPLLIRANEIEQELKQVCIETIYKEINRWTEYSSAVVVNYDCCIMVNDKCILNHIFINFINVVKFSVKFA